MNTYNSDPTGRDRPLRRRRKDLMQSSSMATSETSMPAGNDLAVRRASEFAGVELIDENGGGPGVRLRKACRNDHERNGDRGNGDRGNGDRSNDDDDTATPEIFVPDPQVRREFNVSSMTLARWTADPTLGFPPPMKINGRNFRSRRLLEKFKKDLLRKAIADRAGRTA